MAVFCTACGLEIPLGHESTSINCGTVKNSKKSGRTYTEVHSSDPLHADINCHLLYLAQRNMCDSGQLVDSLTEMVREKLEPDLRVELEDEYLQGKRDELREELIDELGRTCAVCSEEIEEVRAKIDEDDFAPSPRAPRGPYYPVPIVR